MSTAYLPIVEPFTDASARPVVRVLLIGSPVSVAATVYAARAHEIPHEWFKPCARTLASHSAASEFHSTNATT